MKTLTIADQLVKFKRATKCSPWEYIAKVQRGEIKDTPRNRELVLQAEALSRVNYRDDDSTMVETTTKETAR